MKILLYSLAAAVLLTAVLCRYDTKPLPQTAANPRVSFLRLDRWTGTVEIGREYTVGPQVPGVRKTSFAWEPVQESLADLEANAQGHD
jgi:hypothetical protein